MRTVKKILMCLIGDKVGDSVVASFMPRELKRLFPGVQITIMTTAPLDLWKYNPQVDRLLAVPYGAARWRKMLADLPALRREHYDVLIATGESIKRKLFFALIGANKTIIVDPCAAKNAHYSSCFRGVLTQLGSKMPDQRYELFLPTADTQAAASFMQQYHLKEQHFLVFNPIGAEPHRCLHVGKIKEICVGLKQVFAADFPIVLLDYKCQYAALDGVCLRYTSASILQTAALIKQAGYVLTVDTGIAHIADAFEKKMTVLFSLQPFPTEAEARAHLGRWSPRTTGSEMVCTPREMDSISVDEIKYAVQKGTKK